MMKALLSHRAGGPETLILSDIAVPQPGPGTVLVRVRACALNFPDTLIIRDLYQVRPQRPFAPGSDIAGTVEAVGSGVTDFAVGDRVFGAIGSGGLAELVVTAPSKLAKIPEGISFELAAAFMLTYRTSYHALKDRASIRAGERLLVLGAGGGVGLAAVELGKLLGAHVIAAASSPDKLEAARRLGADETFRYQADLGPDGAKRLSGELKQAFPQGFDVVVDPVGGQYAEAALRSLGYDGRLLTIGFPAGIPAVPFNLPLLKSCQIVGVFLGALSKSRPELDAANTAALVEMMAQGRLNPTISETFALEDAPRAIEKLAGRQAMGKLVIRL
ncbi:MAG: NADPH:quinone oxidoreductase family protein [Cypionkella sp.]